ncbi:MAG: PIN domain-containing protein [candidate division WOR-3 bacterium]
MSPSTDRPRLLLVDFENVQQVELDQLDDNFRVVIFVGSSQKSVPFELVTKAQQLGSRIEWYKVSGEGRNALDFFIAFHLGRVMDRPQKPECIVLSKDRGFDPLLRYLSEHGLNCRRITGLHELHQTHGPSSQPPFQSDQRVRRVVELLGRLEKRARPRRRRTLAQSISALYQKKLSRQEIEQVISSMLAQNLITDSEGAITYHF